MGDQRDRGGQKSTPAEARQTEMAPGSSFRLTRRWAARYEWRLMSTPEPTASATPPVTPPACSDRSRRGGCGGLKCIALACLIAGGVTRVVPYFQPHQFVGRTTIELLPLSLTAGSATVEKQPFRDWVGTQAKVLISQATLAKVVGKDGAAAAGQLRQRCEVQVDRNTSLIGLEVWSHDAKEAADTANAIVDAYEKLQIESARQPLERTADTEQGLLDVQEKRTEEKRVAMLSIMKKYNISEEARANQSHDYQKSADTLRDAETELRNARSNALDLPNVTAAEQKVAAAKAALADLTQELVAERARASEYENAKREYQLQFEGLDKLRRHLMEVRMAAEQVITPLHRQQIASPQPAQPRPWPAACRRWGKLALGVGFGLWVLGCLCGGRNRCCR